MRLKPCQGLAPAAIAFGLIFVATLLMANERLFRDHDTYLHVKTGYWMLVHGSVPTVDTYSHTMPGAPWVAHEWLSQLIMGWVHHTAGWFGLVIITAVSVGLAVSILLWFLWQRFEPVRALIFLMPALIGLLTHLLARPHVLVWPLMAWWVASLVNAAQKDQSPPWWSLIVLWFWTNMHGSFVLAFVLLGFIGLDAILRNQTRWRSWVLFGVLSVGVVMINPLGLKILLFPFDLQSGELLTEIGEWKKTSVVGAIPVLIMLGLLVLYHLLGQVRIRFVYWLLLAALVFQAYSHARYVSIATFLIPFFVLPNRTDQKHQGIVTTGLQSQTVDGGFKVVGWVLAVVIVSSALSKWTVEYKMQDRIRPDLALQAVRDHGVTGHVLNGYGFGGFLIFEGVPVFIDGRYDMYGDEFLGRYFSMARERDPDKLGPLLDENRIDWTIFSEKSAINEGLAKLPQWQRLYADELTHVYVREPMGSALK